jgi:hypothetical protein
MNLLKEKSNMSNVTSAGPARDNVNVTLGPLGTKADPLFGKKYPCCLCGNGLEILFTRKKKPYTTCLACGIQTFFRGKAGIELLREIVGSRSLVVGNGAGMGLSAVLFNRIQQLRAGKKELEGKQGLIFQDADLENAIRAFDNEIQGVQDELADLAGRTARSREKK